MFLSKYGEARVIEIPIIKRAVVDFAVGADWTPAAGDVKISKDGGAAANVTNLPTAIAMGNGAIWSFSLTATEMQAARVVVTVVDAATKAVEDQSFVIETYGHASAQHAFDLDTSSVAQTGDSFARLGAPAGASTAADIAAVKTETASIQADTNDIQARLPAALTADGNIKADTLRVGGTLQTAGDIIGDTNDIQARLPAALVGGRMDSNVGSMDAGVITAASIAAAALTAAKFAAGAVDAAALSTDAAQEIRDTVLAGTITELAALPGASPQLKEALALLYMALRNKRDTTASADEIHNDAGTVLATATVSDDGTTFTKAKYV